MNHLISFETERLLLKPTDEDDASFLFYLMNSAKWLKFIGNRDITSFEKARKYIQQRIQPQQRRLGYGNFTVIRKADQKKMGSVGLYEREGLTSLDIGFAFLPRFERQGYASEAAQKLLEAGFDLFGLDKILAITTPDNLASQKVLIKLGLEKAGAVQLPNEKETLFLFQILKQQATTSSHLELF